MDVSAQRAECALHELVLVCKTQLNHFCLLSVCYCFIHSFALHLVSDALHYSMVLTM